MIVVSLLRELALSLVMAAALFLVIDHVTVRSYVDGPSMEPNLRQGQLLLVSRLGVTALTERVQAAADQEDRRALGQWLPSRGSICVFVHPATPGRMLIKRVIGLPDEEIAIRDGLVYIDSEPLDEPYVLFHDWISVPPRRVPPDSVFVLGDNRPTSDDSRRFGPVPRSHIVGVAVLRYWPLTECQLMGGR